MDRCKRFARVVASLAALQPACGCLVVSLNPLYDSEWPRDTRDARGNFEGISYRNASIAQPDAGTPTIANPCHWLGHASPR